MKLIQKHFFPNRFQDQSQVLPAQNTQQFQIPQCQFQLSIVPFVLCSRGVGSLVPLQVQFSLPYRQKVPRGLLYADKCLLCIPLPYWTEIKQVMNSPCCLQMHLPRAAATVPDPEQNHCLIRDSFFLVVFLGITQRTRQQGTVIGFFRQHMCEYFRSIDPLPSK